MKYDYVVAVPFSTEEDVLTERIADFKKFGFFNHERFKIRLDVLVSKKDNIELVKGGWSPNLDVVIHEITYSHVAQKIYDYYHRLIELDLAPWYIRIDEDSMTDFESLDANIKLTGDPEREYHFVGALNYDPWLLDEKLLGMLGFGWWYNHHSNYYYCDTPPHEQEVSITSNVALKKALSSPVCLKYFELRKQFAEGYGDHGLCHCLRMQKIYPTTVKYLTHEAELCNFSYFGGHRSHIHWTSRDRYPKIYEWMEMFTDAPFPEIEDKTFFFGKIGLNKSWIKFCKSKQVRVIRADISLSTEESLGVWCNIDGKLALYTDNNREQIAIFTKQGQDHYVWQDYEIKLIY